MLKSTDAVSWPLSRRTAKFLIFLLTVLLLGLLGVLVTLLLPSVEQPSPSTVGAAAGPTVDYALRPPGNGPFRPRGGLITGDLAYFADAEGGRLIAVDLARGQSSLRSFPLEATEPGKQAPKPQSVALLSDAELLVTDMANGQLLRVNSDGEPAGLFASADELGRSGLKRPVGVAVAAEEVYVTDVGDHRIKVFSRDGVFLRSLGGEGTAPGRFSFPNGIALDKDGQLYVADSNNRRVQVLTPTGEVVRLIGDKKGDPRFSFPRSVAIDRGGRLHVVDTMQGEVFEFEATGVPAEKYGRGGFPEGLVDLPEGIAIGGDKIVLANAGSRLLVVCSY